MVQGGDRGQTHGLVLEVVKASLFSPERHEEELPALRVALLLDQGPHLVEARRFDRLP